MSIIFNSLKDFYNYKNLCIVCKNLMKLYIYQGDDTHETGDSLVLEIQDIDNFDIISFLRQNKDIYFYLVSECKNHSWYDSYVLFEKEDIEVCSYKLYFDKSFTYKTFNYNSTYGYFKLDDFNFDNYLNLDFNLKNINSQKALLRRINCMKTFQ